jgi:hypothetical protein
MLELGHFRNPVIPPATGARADAISAASPPAAGVPCSGPIAPGAR